MCEKYIRMRIAECLRLDGDDEAVGEPLVDREQRMIQISDSDLRYSSQNVLSSGPGLYFMLATQSIV